jgi:hypothetical protein
LVEKVFSAVAAAVGNSAMAYRAAWRDLPIMFPKAELARVPAHMSWYITSTF